MAKHVVGRVEDVPPGERLITTISGRSIGIFNVDGTLFALRNRCPHQGAELCRGTLHGAVESPVPGTFVHDGTRPILRCPWHGWEFDLETGRSWCDPARTRVRRYAVEVSASDQPVAESYPVSVEDRYIVVDLGR